MFVCARDLRVITVVWASSRQTNSKDYVSSCLPLLFVFRNFASYVSHDCSFFLLVLSVSGYIIYLYRYPFFSRLLSLCYIFLSVYLSIHLSIYMLTYLSTYLFTIYIYIYTYSTDQQNLAFFLRASIYLSVCRSIYLSS